MPKHYPGGNHLIEVTERNAVSFAAAPKALQPWVDQWSAVFGMKNPPKCIMLAHAQYAPENFALQPNASFQSSLLNSKFEFSALPASLNPLLVSHLHHVRNYKGLTIGDWYDMGAIRQFASGVALTPPAPNRRLHTDTVALLLGLEADVDLLPGLRDSDDELASYVKTMPNFAAIDAALTASLKRTCGRLTALGMDSPDENLLSSLSFEDRLALKRGHESAVPHAASFHAFVNPHADVWNRQGVLTLLQRARVIESLSGVAMPPPPQSLKDEAAWADALLANSTFKKFNQAIPWDSPEVRALFEERERTTADELARR